VKEDVLDLQFVLVVGVAVAQVAELFCLVETPFKVFRRNEIFGHLDAVVDVADLEEQYNI
jgi:hypothetical protein